MENKKNIKPIFDWAIKNGDANIVDRIIVKIIPQIIKENIQLTTKSIKSSEKIEVNEEFYNLTKEKAEELVGSSFDA